MRFDGSGAVLDRGPLEAVAHPGERVTVLAPSPDVRIETVRLPAGSAAQLRRALPFAVEEGLAGELADVQLIHGERVADGRHAVAIVGRRRLAGWLTRLGGAQARLDSVVPEALCVPWRRDEVVALDTGERLLLRWGEAETAVVEEGTSQVLFDTLAGLLAERTAPRLRWLSDGSSPERWRGAPSLGVWQSESVSVDAVLAEGAVRSPLGLDLLSGRVAEAVAEGEPGGRRWRTAAVVATLGCGLLGADLWLDVRQLEAERDRFDQAARAAWLEAFPGSRATGDLQRLVRQRLQARQGGGSAERPASVFDLLGAVAEQMRAERIRLDALRYGEQRLELDLGADSIADIERWRSALAARMPSLRVQAEAMEASGRGAAATLVVAR